MLSVAIVTGCARRANLDDEEEKALPMETDETAETLTAGGAVSEPFYNSKKLILEAPLPEDEEYAYFEYSGCDDPIITGNHILVRMYYACREDDEAPADWILGRWNVFDLDGKYVTTLNADFFDYVSPVVWFDEDEQGRFTCAYLDYEYSEDQWSAQINLARFDQNGNMITEPTYAFSDAYSTNLSMAVDDKNGEIIVASQHKIVQLDENFTMQSEHTYSNAAEIRNLWEDQGEIYMETTEVDENYQESACIYHLEFAPNGYLTDAEPGRDASNLLSMKMFQTNAGIYAATRNALGKLDLGSGEYSTLLDWNQTDIDRSLVNYGQLKVLSEGRLSSGVSVIDPTGSASTVTVTPDAPQNDYPADDDDETITSVAITSVEYIDAESVPCLYLLSETDENPHEGQDVLWIGGIGITSSGLMTAIADYNNTHSQDTWIKVYDYAGFNYNKTMASTSETQKALERMAAQLNSGTGPDIIVGGGESGLFDNSNILTDLNGYVDGISGINRDDYFNSALEAFETDGKLYQIPLVFSVRALVGNRNIVFGNTYMNYADYLDAGYYLNDSVYLFSEVNLDELTNMLIEGETGTWINYSNGTVNIDHEKLMEMLQLIQLEDMYGMNGYMAAVDSIYVPLYDPMVRGCYQEIYLNRSAFAPSTMNSVCEYAQTKIMPEALSWYGYPGSQGSTKIIQSDISVGISASSTQKEKAWEVIKYFLGENVQTTLSGSGVFDVYDATCFIPLNREAFQEVNSEDIYTSDIYTYAMDADGNWVQFYAGDREELMKEYTEALNAPMRRYIRDPQIINIVKGAVEDYIYGECTLEDAAYKIEKEITAFIER